MNDLDEMRCCSQQSTQSERYDIQHL